MQTKNVENVEKNASEHYSEISSDLNFISKIQKIFHQTEIKKSAIQTEFLREKGKILGKGNHLLEIGSELCLSRKLDMHSHVYTFFSCISGIGKSMEGAISSIIFGSLLWSILERTQSSPYTWSKSGEKWLEDAFHESYSAIKNFNNLIEISSIIGLFDHQEESLSYINTGNLNMILHREGIARYFDKEKRIELNEEFNVHSRPHINTFSLLPGDNLFCGTNINSNISIFEDKKEKMNQINDFMLYWIENTNGELSELKKRILENGSLEKDISILKINYNHYYDTETNLDALK